MKVWVLVIDHREGTNVNLFATKEAAEKALFDWCDDWFPHEFPGETRPPDDKLVEEYWSLMSEWGEEWHRLEECEVEGATA